MRRLCLFVSTVLALACGGLLLADNPPKPAVPQFIAELRAGRVTEDAIYAHIAQRSNEAAAQCLSSQYDRLASDEAAFREYLVEKSSQSKPMEQRYTLLIGNLNSAYATAKYACNPAHIAIELAEYGAKCKLDQARSELAKLTALNASYRLQAQAAAAAASENLSAVDKTVTERWATSAKAWLEVGRRKMADIETLCAKSKATTPAAGPMTGRWISRIYGGAIHTSLGPDGKLTAKIVAMNPIMQRNGYSNGMEVLREWSPGNPDSIWLAKALNGEYFLAQQPDRKPGEQYGNAKWEKSGVIYIARKKPNELELPATLSNRLSNYDPWVKDGP